MDDALASAVTRDRIAQVAGVRGGLHEVDGLHEGLVLVEGDDDGALVALAGDDDFLAVVDDLVEDLGLACARLGVGHGLHGCSSARLCTEHCT